MLSRRSMMKRVLTTLAGTWFWTKGLGACNVYTGKEPVTVLDFLKKCGFELEGSFYTINGKTMYYIKKIDGSAEMPQESLFWVFEVNGKMIEQGVERVMLKSNDHLHMSIKQWVWVDGQYVCLT